MEKVLKDKVIIIVGGTSGMGLSAAEACIRAGARVVALGRSKAKAQVAQEILGTEACVVTGDAMQSDTVSIAIEQAIERYGAIHGLYHVAGGSGRRKGDGPLHEISDEGWEHTIQHNLTSMFYSNRAAVQQLLKQGIGGSILNMSSVLGFSPSPHHFATHAYTTAKSAVLGMTKSLAAYYAKDNIRFNVLAPALVDTPMATRATNDSEIMQFIRTKQPLDGSRIGQPTDLDAAVVYFLSDDSRFVTGQVLAVDGGWSVSEGQYS